MMYAQHRRKVVLSVGPTTSAGGRLGVNLFRRNVVRNLGHDGVGGGVDDAGWLAEDRHSDGVIESGKRALRSA